MPDDDDRDYCESCHCIILASQAYAVTIDGRIYCWPCSLSNSALLLAKPQGAYERG